MKRILASAGALLFLSLGLQAQAAEVECDRECLTGFMDLYLEGIVTHDVSKIPVSRNMQYTENGVRLNLGDGLWQTASASPTYRVDVIDEEAGQIGMIGRISENGNNNWYGVRLKIERGEEVSEIETLVNRGTGGGGFGGIPMDEPHPMMMQTIPASERLTRSELVSISDHYFTGLDTENDGGNVPFSSECQRRENGNVTANNTTADEGSMLWMDCKAQFDTGFSTIVTDIRERRFEVVDPVTGLAFGWVYFDHDGAAPQLDENGVDPQAGGIFRQPFAFYIAEIFKVVDGDIRQIEAVLATVPYGMPSGW